MSKVFFFDVDGTIIDHGSNTIPKSTIEAIKILQEKGYYCVLATGKPVHLIKDLLKLLNINFYISFNGNYVVADGNVIFNNPIDKKEVKMCASIYHKYGINVAFEGVDGIYSMKENDYMTKLAFNYFNLEYPTYYENYYNDHEVYQCLLMTSEVNDEIKNTIPGLQAVRSNPYLFDVNPVGGLKEVGVDKILEYLNLSKDNAIAFGDGYNDIGMIKTVGLGIAMGQGNHDLKKSANYITKEVGNDGIYHALKHFEFI